MNPAGWIDTTPAIVLVVAIGALVIAGTYLVLERSLTRVLVGTLLLGNGVNLLFLVASGRAGNAPIIGDGPEADMSDPLPQAMVLTAIVITLGITAFILAMAYRSWQLHGHDEVQDDLEDRRVARIAAHNQPTVEDVDTSDEDTLTLDDQAAEVRDEVEGAETEADAQAAVERAAAERTAAEESAAGADSSEGPGDDPTPPVPSPGHPKDGGVA